MPLFCPFSEQTKNRQTPAVTSSILNSLFL
nr:MAG TPA: hypothetical protein [Caudoviricetes sp.]DAS50898.1 MAG TPA: hypothetical protein [Caudoviricetes sp.]